MYTLKLISNMTFARLSILLCMLMYASLTVANMGVSQNLSINLKYPDSLPNNLNANQLKQYAQLVNSNTQELADKINATNQKQIESPTGA